MSGTTDPRDDPPGGRSGSPSAGDVPLTAPARVALVFNAGARRGAEALELATGLLAARPGTDLAVHAVPAGGDLCRALDVAVADAPDLLVVGGGDGTVGAAAARVADRPTVLGVLPLGTANDFARTLEIPGDVAAAVEVLTTGHVVDVDLGVAGGATYLNVASVGLSVGVTARLRPGLKKRLGPLAYPVATLAAYRSHEPFTAHLAFPDGDHPPLVLRDLLQVAVGNGRHYGGGNAVSPTASLDDGTLDVYAIVRGRLRDHVSIARLLRDGSFVDHEQVHHLTTTRVVLRTEPELPVNLDGEVTARTPLAFSVRRNAVRVLVPRGSTGARLG